MKFTKMHGLGNDYIYVNCFKEKIENPSEIALKISDRHFGIGSDGLVMILPSDIADFRMRMFNSDGSESEMCGNAIRCVGKFVYDKGLTKKEVVNVETLAGIKVLELKIFDGIVESVRVDMGEPELIPSKIPVDSQMEKFISESIQILDKEFKVTAVSMGNPHAVSFIDEVDKFELQKYGSKMETHKLFPRKVNAEFVKVRDKTTLQMRVWERGAGETLACGTGACAVLVAAVLNGLSERKATIKLLGGDLMIEWNEANNRVYKTGPATFVFEGEIDV